MKLWLRLASHASGEIGMVQIMKKNCFKIHAQYNFLPQK